MVHLNYYEQINTGSSISPNVIYGA